MALNNGGDTVAIWSSLADYQGDEAAFANAVDGVAYTDGGAFPDVGGAESISLNDLTSDNADGTNWAASADEVLFYDAGTLQFLGAVQVGSLPDMLTFNTDGTVLLASRPATRTSRTWLRTRPARSR